MDPYIGKSDSPLNDVRVRKAVSLTVNRKDIVAKLLDGEAELAGSWGSRYVPGYVSLPPDEFNPADAKKLLEAAGYANGFDVDFYPAPPAAEYNSVLVADWKKIGINANMKVLDGAAWGNVILGKKTPGIVVHLTGANYVDPANWGLFTLSNGSVSFNNSPKLDELMTKIVNGTDDQARAAAWGEVQQQVYDERIYQVLWHENALTAVGRRIKEWTGVPGIGYIIGVEYAKL
jgi:peptide/nickel transport system substrate-binding protein